MFRPCLFILLLPLSQPAWAGQWLLQHDRWQAGSDLQSQRETRLQYDWQAADSAGHLRFAYQPLHLSESGPFPEAAHNGHLYEYGLRYEHHWSMLSLGVAAGAHISSNMFIHADLREEALVGSLDLRLGATDDEWRPGMAADHRFGRFLLYPTLQWQSADRSLLIELPNRMLWRSGEGDWSMSIERYGQKWGVLDRDRQQASKVYLNEWRLELRRHWPLSSESAVEAGLGMSVDRQLRYQATSGRVSRVRPDDRLFLSLAWRQSF